MSVQDTDADDSCTDTDGAETVVDPSVVSAMREATPSQREAIDELVTAAKTNGVEQTLSADVTEYGKILVDVEPDETWHNEGEGGFDSLYVAVTSHKGVAFGRRDSPTGHTDLDDTSFDEVVRRVEMMH